MTYKTMIHNADTNEIVERDATADEIANIENLQTKRKTIQDNEAALEATKEAAQAKLAALGLTADDLKALGL